MSMVDLYEIGISFLIERDIFSDVETLNSGMVTLQTAIDQVNTSLTKTADLLGSITGAASGMAASWEAAATAAERMSAAADRMGGGGADGSSPARPGGPPVVAAGGVGDGEGGGGFTMPGYRDPNLLPIAGPDGSYPPAPGGGSPSQSHINPWDYIIAGGVAYEGGKGAVTSAYDNAAAVQHQSFLMENQGASSSAAGDAVNAAQALQQKYPGLSQAQAMTIIRDAYMQTRNMPEAIGMANSLAEAAYVMQGFGDDDAAEAMFSLSRSGELRGLLNQKNPDGSVALGGFENFIDAYTKAAISTGGRVTPTDALTILKNAGPEGLMMDQDAMTDALILSTTMGASGVGTGINALATQFLGGKMSQGSAQNLHRAGLLPDYMFGKDGKILDKYKNGLGNVLLPNGALENEDEFEKNPFEWIQDTFDPAVSKLDPGSKTALLNSIYADMSRIPGARLAAETLFQQGFLDRQIGFLGNVPSVGTAAQNLTNDPQNVSGGFTSAFEAFMAQIGSDGMPTATAQLKALTGALNDMTDWAKHHPNAGNDVFRGGEAVAVGGAGLTLLGVYKLIQKALGIGGKGGGADASFADADGTAAGEGAVDLGLGGAGAGGSGIALGSFVAPAGLIALVAAAAKAANDAEFGPGWEKNYRVAGKGVVFTGGAGTPTGQQHDPIYTYDLSNGGGAAPGAVPMPTGPNGHNSALTPHLPGVYSPGGQP